MSAFFISYYLQYIIGIIKTVFVFCVFVQSVFTWMAVVKALEKIDDAKFLKYISFISQFLLSHFRRFFLKSAN